MGTLRFSDGVSIETSGVLRPLKLADGWYVVGEGTCCPVADADEARAEIERRKARKGNS